MINRMIKKDIVRKPTTVGSSQHKNGGDYVELWRIKLKSIQQNKFMVWLPTFRRFLYGIKQFTRNNQKVKIGENIWHKIKVSTTNTFFTNNYFLHFNFSDFN